MTGAPATRIRAWHSLRLRLPAAIALLIVAVVATLGILSYREIARADLQFAAARAQAASVQIAGVLTQSIQQRLAEWDRFIDRAPRVTACVHTRSDENCAAAAALLRALPSPTSQHLELWSAAGERILMVQSGPDALSAPSEAPTAAGVRPLRSSGNTVLGETVLPIVDRSRLTDVDLEPEPIGFVVAQRPLAQLPSRDLLNRLLGGAGTVSFGNVSGDVWTNLATAVPRPAVDLASPGVKSFVDATGARRLGALAFVQGTPWAIWIDFPQSAILQPARAFLVRMSGIAAIFLLLACGAAVMITRRVTTPLTELAGMSEAIARGDYSARVETRRRDELGRLSRAFNAMALDVQTAHDNLEQTVRERTTGLESARRELEERVVELQEARGEQERFFALSPDLLCVASTEGRLIKVNAAWEQLLGWTCDELTAVPYLDFVHPDDVRATQAEASNQVGGSDTLRFENRYRRKDGTYAWLSWKAAVDSARGLVYAAARDVTERKQAAQAIETHMQELAAVNQELEAFSYSVSHDLRAPLRHVTGFAALLEQSSGSTLDEEGRRLLAKINSSATRMGRLIDDLLAFSRVSRTSLTKSRIDLNALVQESWQEVSVGLNGRHVEWRCDRLPSADADPALLRLVLVNLLSNALKYTAGRERTQISVGGTRTANELTIFVCDNGVGFDPAYRHKLFGVFQRLHSADQFEGTGIGLANVRRIIQRHGGRTWAEGAPDAGATFYFSLPETTS
ncbi:MAG TPA: ATP-binding protein [Vicinamibacterales bacterium]|nr:ATP-binding protein [Vicinamibacterales bacterium]